ncbi:hypothetical protein Tco_0168693 [Tanacetum coccineum]
MVKLSVDLNEPKDSSKTDKAAQNVVYPNVTNIGNPPWRVVYTNTYRSYIGGQVSSVNVVDIDEFCLHDLKDMVVKLGYGVEDLMYCHFLIPSLGLDYGLHSLNVDADVLEMEKYIKDYKIILVYVEHGSSNVDTSIFVTREKGVAIAVDNRLRKAPIEIDSSLDVNRNLTPLCHRILEKDYVEAPIVVECAEDPFEDLDDILGEYAHLGKQITGNEITGNKITRNESTGNEMTRKQMVEGNDTSGSDLEDLDYDPNHDDVFDDDEHIVEEVHVNMNNFSFTADPKHDTIIVQDQMQKQFEVGVSKMKAFRAKRIASDIMTGTNVQIDVQGPWPGQILTGVRVDANNGINPVAYAIVEAESKRYCVRHIHENMKSQFKGGVFKEMLWNAAKATSEGEFKRKMGELKSLNADAYDWLMKIPLEQWSRAYFSGRAKCDLLINICEVFNRQLVDGRDQPIITCLEYIIEYLMKRIVVVQKVIAKTVGPLTPSVTKMFGVIKKATKPPKKRKTLNDEIASQSASSSKLYRKGKSVSCGKCGNMGHNKKGYMGQGGGSSQAGARRVKLLVQGRSQVKLLVQEMYLVKLLVQGRLQVNPVQHKAQQTKDQGKVFRDQ